MDHLVLRNVRYWLGIVSLMFAVVGCSSPEDATGDTDPHSADTRQGPFDDDDADGSMEADTVDETGDARADGGAETQTDGGAACWVPASDLETTFPHYVPEVQTVVDVTQRCEDGGVGGAAILRPIELVTTDGPEAEGSSSAPYFRYFDFEQVDLTDTDKSTIANQTGFPEDDLSTAVPLHSPESGKTSAQFTPELPDGVEYDIAIEVGRTGRIKFKADSDDALFALQNQLQTGITAEVVLEREQLGVTHGYVYTFELSDSSMALTNIASKE